MRKFLIALIAALGLTEAAAAQTILFSHEVDSSIECLTREYVIDETITAGVPGLTWTETGDTVVFTSPSRDVDYRVTFKDGCLVLEEAIEKKPKINA